MLSASLKDVKFRNPVGLGAGMDKSGEAIEPLLDLGFGFKEVNVAVGADASNGITVNATEYKTKVVPR